MDEPVTSIFSTFCGITATDSAVGDCAHTAVASTLDVVTSAIATARADADRTGKKLHRLVDAKRDAEQRLRVADFILNKLPESSNSVG